MSEIPARQFGDPLGKGIHTFSPTDQAEYSSKDRSSTPIRIVCDSCTTSFDLTKMVLSMDVSAYNNGTAITPGADIKNTYLGLEAIIQSLTITAAGQVVEKIHNYPAFLSSIYKNMSAGHKKLLRQLSGYSNDNIFDTRATVSMNMHPWVGFCNPKNKNFFHVFALPDQTLEFTIALAHPASVFPNGNVDEIRVSNIRLLMPYHTPSPQFVNATRAISYEYTRTTQALVPASGTEKNIFNLNMSGVRSLQGFDAMFVDANADTTKDAALNYSSWDLREWRLVLGMTAIPSGKAGFKHSTTDNQTLLASLLSQTDFDSLGDMDISFADYDKKQFSFGWSFQDRTESSSAGLSFEGTNSSLKIATIHDTVLP
ncbi:hypothetical protein BC832DRAFT_542729 [Gaertneriomyces semiglobifer]|nr:hypothetical protein BC832DRAFT_542729 [Gaertneriomyces semiglobifer]